MLVIQNGQPRQVPVTQGMTAGDLTEVSGDLKEGDQVVIITAPRAQTTTPGGPGGFFGGRPFGD